MAHQNEHLTHCASARDGECWAKECPQLRDGEPHRSGRTCPLPLHGDADEEESPTAPSSAKEAEHK